MGTNPFNRSKMSMQAPAPAGTPAPPDYQQQLLDAIKNGGAGNQMNDKYMQAIAQQKAQMAAYYAQQQEQQRRLNSLIDPNLGNLQHQELMQLMQPRQPRNRSVYLYGY